MEKNAVGLLKNAPPSPPLTRDCSPSPSISPTPALSACPPLDRSVSAASSASTFSRDSSASASVLPRRRGYVRPQRATFADSARNRDSVMSLGSIAHLQYYFARTGLLDGKGGQLAKEGRKASAAGEVRKSTPTRSVSEPTLSPDITHLDEELAENVIPLEGECQAWEEFMMLPPTVSTYSHRIPYLEPPPDTAKLNSDLVAALLNARNALQQVRDQNKTCLDRRKSDPDPASTIGAKEHDFDSCEASERSTGWHGIQGLHILDVTTLAIQAAKLYYTNHEHPQRLSEVKSERRIRQELLAVMDVLKRMAGRNFEGGIRDPEFKVIEDWIRGVEALLAEEAVIERQEKKRRESWIWLEGSWKDRDRQRERLFMNSFISHGSLPEWIPPARDDHRPSAFLRALSDGVHLVQLHNAMLKKSKRQFGDIKTFHTDTAKPYRRAENLRYWIKAAEIRWETKLQVNVMGIAHGREGDIWAEFDTAILQWSETAREDLAKEWSGNAPDQKIMGRTGRETE